MDIPLLPDIVAIFCLSIGVLLVCHPVKIPPIVGFLLTGVLCGPTALGLVQNPHAVELLAEIGVVLLLFSIGLEMSGEELMRLKRPVFVGGTAQVVLTVGAFMCLGVLTGQTWQQSMMSPPCPPPPSCSAASSRRRSPNPPRAGSTFPCSSFRTSPSSP